MTSQKSDSPPAKPKGFDKRAEALRENLRKRKQQARGRVDDVQQEKK